jgi:hypothetical protein
MLLVNVAGKAVAVLSENTENYIVRFEDLTAVVMKNPIFSYIKQCSSLKINRRFGETSRLFCCTYFMLVSYFDYEDGSYVFSRNFR